MPSSIYTLARVARPPGGVPDDGFRKIIVSTGNSDPYPDHDEAIHALGKQFGLTLDRDSCYPYNRTRSDEAA